MAIGQYSSQVVATQLEQVRPKLAEFLVRSESKLAQLFKKQAEKHRVSAWTAGSGAVQAWRIPVMLSVGGDYQAFSLDGGDLGTGSLMDTVYMTLGYYATDIAFNVPALAAWATKTDQQAISNAMAFSVGNAIKETALYNEIGLFQDGTGILATSTAVSGTGTNPNPITYTLETAAFTYIRLRGFNQLLDVANSSNAIVSTGQRITNINFAANQVTVAGGTTYTAASGDQLVFPGMGPVTTTLASGSFRYGIYTFNTTNTSGSLLGLSYSTAYELACPQVNGGGGYYTPSVLLAGKSQLIQRRDDAAWAGMIGITHMAQRAAWYLESTVIAEWRRDQVSQQALDLVPTGNTLGDTFQAGEITHYVSRYANKSRVDWINPKNWGKVMLDDINFFQSPEGQRIFVGRVAATGNPSAGFQFYVTTTDNVYSVDPGCSLVAYNLGIPAGQ